MNYIIVSSDEFLEHLYQDFSFYFQGDFIGVDTEGLSCKENQFQINDILSMIDRGDYSFLPANKSFEEFIRGCTIQIGDAGNQFIIYISQISNVTPLIRLFELDKKFLFYSLSHDIQFLHYWGINPTNNLFDLFPLVKYILKKYFNIRKYSLKVAVEVLCGEKMYKESTAGNEYKARDVIFLPALYEICMDVIIHYNDEYAVGLLEYIDDISPFVAGMSRVKVGGYYPLIFTKDNYKMEPYIRYNGIKYRVLRC